MRRTYYGHTKHTSPCQHSNKALSTMGCCTLAVIASLFTCLQEGATVKQIVFLHMQYAAYVLWAHQTQLQTVCQNSQTAVSAMGCCKQLASQTAADPVCVHYASCLIT
jgi:TorA maturation chaperone TorD